jgi:two-component system, NtrC family, nitrogen regulation response regulator NtrX
MTIVLVIDDVAALAEQYAYDLRRLGKFETLIAASGDAGLDVLTREPVDCVILDLEMPAMDGFEVLRKMRERAGDQHPPVIVYTGTGNYDRCIQAIRLGAHSFIDKAEPMERVVHEVESAIERSRLTTEIASLRKYLSSDSALRGQSAAMRKLKDEIARVAPIPSPVLIMGESGTGKELVARELHQHGGNSKEPFVAVNSAALPENLVESELFGHERGAFTGAATLRKGAFESAGKGTLFLDEIGELPLQAQAKLLRVLEERQITRVGASKPINVAARVVAATNRNLEDEVNAGRFRRDLFYRLNVHVLRVPPLRDRLSDVPELADHMLERMCERFGAKRKELSAEALQALVSYDWHQNNVRELRNIVERMIIAADGDTIGVEHVPQEIRDEGTAAASPSMPGRTFLEQKAEAERQIITMALQRNEWQITRTAHELGLADHSSLLKIMRRHGIVRP